MIKLEPLLAWLAVQRSFRTFKLLLKLFRPEQALMTSYGLAYFLHRCSKHVVTLQAFQFTLSARGSIAVIPLFVALTNLSIFYDHF